MILILGGGPAGRMAAIRAAGAGEEVTLVEKRLLGGQCLHDGCMQVCGLNDCARLIRSARLAARSGITRGVPEVDFPELLAQLTGIQMTIGDILDHETRSAGVEIIYGAEGRLEEGKAYVNGKIFDAEKIIIATGSRPVLPDISGINLPGIFTPHTLKQMKRLPDRIGIIGGGVMAAEFAYIFSSFGVKTHIICRSEFLHQIPLRLRKEALKDLDTVIIHENADISDCIGDDTVTGLRFNGTVLNLDSVLITAGLKPNSDMIRGVDKGKNGEILVNSMMETSVPGIFACGDVIGEPCLTPVARLQGFAAADAALGRDSSADLSYIPQSMSLGYEYTWCESREDEGVTISLPGPAGPGTFWSVPERRTGISCLKVNPDDGRILSFSEASPAAGVMGMYLAYMAKKGVKVQDLAKLHEVHPTSDGMYATIRYIAGHLKKKTEISETIGLYLLRKDKR
ncbi:MAG: NAD(P)/FAD-dependent oxidoreductase [Methanocalculus sp.]|uniref:NAD(P)/FAD-dependent oxidoreductase n=1 Tax=Methanocalculus sp. TaxID=2004547 RepID=UPI00271E7733|nr:NAD(P)/FAD-dependent oxidoreductase [Methanocalculus sp.]MDO9539211.1 NAD(P)/FAD-dependent oxidoreductase [Methanocalculus sp.]